MDSMDTISIKACWRRTIKRFKISSECSYADLICLILEMFGKTHGSLITDLKFVDEDNELITLSSEEDFTEALKSVPKTNGLLRLFIDETTQTATSCQIKRKTKLNTLKEQLLNANISKPPSYIAQQAAAPLCPKGPRMTTTEMMEKQRGRAEKRYRKKDSSSSSSDERSPSRDSSLSSLSSYSDSSQDEFDEQVLKKNLRKFEKSIHKKVVDELNTFKDTTRNELVTSIKRSVLNQLEGAAIHTIPGPAMPPSKPLHSNWPRYHHQNVTCDHCEGEIFGPRYKCGNCSDYDLCESCEAIEGIHSPSHVFLKIRYPSIHPLRSGRKSHPLLRMNIYETREIEREREELIQRKLSSGSEMGNVKSEEQMERLRHKLNKFERRKEEFELDREDWKRIKKKLKKPRKYLKNKTKANDIQQEKKQESVSPPVILSPTLPPKQSGSVETPEQGNEPPQQMLVDTETSQDRNLRESLASIQIVDRPDDPVADSTATSESDVIVVRHEDVPEDQRSVDSVEVVNKPDLVEFLSEPTSEDFYVVTRCFDLNASLDDLQHVDHSNCHDTQCNHGSVDQEIPADELRIFQSDRSLLPPTTFDENTPVAPPQESSSNPTNIMDAQITESLPFDLLSPNSNASEDDTHHEDMPLDLITPPLGVVVADSPAVVDQQPQPQPQSPRVANIEVVQPVDLVACAQNNPNGRPDLMFDCEEMDRSTSSEVEFRPPITTPVVTTQPQNSMEIVEAHVVMQPTTTPRLVPIPRPPVTRQPDPSPPANPPRLLDQACAFNSQQQQQTPSIYPRLIETEDDERPEESAVTIVTQDNQQHLPKREDQGLIAGVVGMLGEVKDAILNVNTPQVQYSVPQSPREGEIEAVPNYWEALQKLLDMGFFDRKLNTRLLQKHNNDVNKCVQDLVEINENNWNQNRH